MAAEVTGNAVPGVPHGRGIAVVLGDRAEASVRLLRNRLAGHRGEALYVLAGAASRLALELRDNEVAAAPPSAAAPLPALLLQARDEARLCLALAGNRVGAGTGGGPPMALRQAGRPSSLWPATSPRSPAARPRGSPRATRSVQPASSSTAPSAPPPACSARRLPRNRRWPPAEPSQGNRISAPPLLWAPLSPPRGRGGWGRGGQTEKQSSPGRGWLLS